MDTIRVLRTLLAVDSEGSFAGAAQRVALTQAAVGQQMRALEVSLGRVLFDRQGKAVALNEAAQALLPGARQLVAQYEQLMAAPTPQPMTGTVHLGAIVSAVRPLIEATLALKQRHPALALHVSAAKSMELLARVDDGALDAAVVVREPGSTRPGLAWTPLYDEPMVLLAARTMPDGTARRLLQQQAFIRFDRSQHTGALVERSLRRLRARPNELIELNAIEAIVDLVRAGLGVAVLPLLHGARWGADARLRVIELPGADRRQIAMVQRRDAAQAPVAAAIAREFQAQRSLT